VLVEAVWLVCATVLLLVVAATHRMHEMRAFAIDDPGVCQAVCYAASQFHCAKMAERIMVLKDFVSSI